MTPKQKEMLDFITAFINDNGFSPSYQEIADALNMKSRGQIRSKLKILSDDGLINITGKSRGITLAQNDKKTIAKIVDAMTLFEAGFGRDGSMRCLASIRVALQDGGFME